MILPFSSIQVADATTETITDFTAYELWILDNTPSLKDVSEDRKQKHISEVREYINSLSGYEKKMMAEINVLAEKYQKFNDGISQQKPKDVTDKLKQQMQTQLFSMEEIELTTQDRWDASPEYWKNKVLLAKQSIEEPETSNVSGYNGQNGLYSVHQSDLALKRVSLMTFPCFGFWNAFVPCPVLGYGWNNGETRISWDVIPTDGRVSYDSSVCVDSNTHHNSVTFDMNTKRKMISNIQTVVYDYTDSETPTLTGNAGECEDNYKEKTVSAGARISMTTGISNIDLN